jgi:DNA-binding NarL/FixJ family response regulator/signal transduction histidine kinase
MFGCSLAYSLCFAVLLAVAASTGILAHSGWSQQALRDLAPQLGLSLAFSLLLGVWISRIIDQSRDRGQLITELGATRDELAAAQRAQGALAERERMAREIHDTLAQGFTSIVMLAQAATARLPRDPDGAAERLATIEDVARDNLAEARALVAALAPVDLDGATLADAVRRTAARFARESGIEVSVDVSLDVPLDVPVELADGDPARGPAAAGALGRAQQVVVLRAVQEALANVRRHARAAHVMLRLRRDGDQTRLEVVDDGTGFSPEIACAGGGFGLDGMRGRVAAIGGELDVVSAPGAGTPLVVRVPAQVPAGGVLVVDDHPVVRAGLIGLLDVEDDLDVVGEAADGAEAVARVAADPPDVVLMDLRMPRMDGAAATGAILAAYPGVRVLVLTTYDTDADIVRAVEAGATGYLLKDTPRAQLVAAVRAAARGETVLGPAVAARLVSRLRAPATEPPTPREVQVLAAVARGLSNAEIGRELGIGEATVKTHLLRAFAKLGVDDRTRAVTVAMERGILPAPGAATQPR